MKDKHTPGPWRDDNYGIRGAGGYICAIHWPHCYEGQEDRYQKEMAERQGDARLIASAPDMATEIDRLRASNAELIAALVVAFEAMDRMRECAEGKHVGSESEICYQLNLAQEIVQAELAKVQP